MLTESGLLHGEGGAVNTCLPDWVYLHEQASLLGAGDVKSPVTVGFVALNGGSSAFLLTQVAGELPASGRDVTDPLHGLKEHRVGKANFWDPYGTDNMGPTPITCLFEGTSSVGTENTVYRAGGGLQAAAAQPLALGDVGHTVTLLVDGQVTDVTEQDDVTVQTFVIQADAAECILVDSILGQSLAAGLQDGLPLQAVDEQLKSVRRYGCMAIGHPLLVHHLQPGEVLLVHVILCHAVLLLPRFFYVTIVGCRERRRLCGRNRTQHAEGRLRQRCLEGRLLKGKSRSCVLIRAGALVLV